MPEIDGFQLLQLLDFRNFDLIITTAYNQYAIQAFKANAIDYLLKPIDPDDLLQAIEKVKLRQINNNSTKNIENVLNKLVKKGLDSNRKIPISVSNKIILVEPSDILYLKSDGSYTTIYMKNNKEFLVSKSIKFFEELLPDIHFLRIHKSYIVNINEIKEFLKHGNGEVVLSNEKIIPVSRRHRQNILDALHIS
jgi:two-component system LytT family response regulator